MTADVSMEKKFMNSEYPEITHEDSKNSTDSFNANIIVISNPFSGSFVSFNNNYNSSNDYKQNDSIDNPSPKKEKIMKVKLVPKMYTLYFKYSVILIKIKLEN